MYNEIIELLPSKTLKSKIYETGYKFTETELIYIIYEYAKTFGKRIEMLRRFAKCASKEAAKNALMLADWQEKAFKDFCEDSEGYIYELRIREEEYCEERFICASYEAALKYIDLYYDEYKDIGVTETEKSRYQIVKRRIYGGKDDEVFGKDCVAECILGTGKRLISVDERSCFCGDESANCAECEKVCHSNILDLRFPCFVKDGDIIKYNDTIYDNEGIEEWFGSRHIEEHYGIAFAYDNEPMDAIYTLPFHSEAIFSHRYDEDSIFHSHDHISAPLAEVVSIDELNEKMKADYLAYMEHLKNNKTV